MMRLGINIDHVATIRQQRRGVFPDPVEAARLCEQAGASSIVCHLREDRRHVQDADVHRLRRAVQTRLNLEMSIAPSIVRTALAVRPDTVTLVPERRQELTTEGGLDAARLAKRLRRLLPAFARRDIAVSLFIDPDRRQVDAACALGVPVIELHTGRFAEASTPRARAHTLRALREAARHAAACGLEVAAGHGLAYGNVRAVARIREVGELNIGFAIISRALAVGLPRAVREMRARMRGTAR